MRYVSRKYLWHLYVSHLIRQAINGMLQNPYYMKQESLEHEINDIFLSERHTVVQKNSPKIETDS